MQSLPTTNNRLLLADDDEKFCRLISDYLKRFGYEVTSVHNGPEAADRATHETWDAIILDVMIPGMDGFEILQKVREQSSTPILMFTALGDETDRVVGLEMGADDYLPKTSSPRELLARLRAVLRRATRPVVETTPSGAEEIILGPLVINNAARMVSLEGAPLSLTPVEYDILWVLVQSRGRIKSREELLNEIRDRNYDVFDRSIDVHISALRRKLNDDPKSPKFIRTVRAAGYMMIQPQDK